MNTFFSFSSCNLTFTKLLVKIFGNPPLPYFTNSDFNDHFFLLVENNEKDGKNNSLITKLTAVLAQSSHLNYDFKIFEQLTGVSPLCRLI